MSCTVPLQPRGSLPPDVVFSTLLRQISLRMNPQERCDSTAPTSDTKIKTEAKPATVGKKIWRARASKWQVDHQSTRETAQGPAAQRHEQDEKGPPRATISSLVITTGPSLPRLSNPPTFCHCSSHFSRLSATRLIPAPCLFTLIPVPVSCQFGLNLGPEVGSCSL